MARVWCWVQTFRFHTVAACLKKWPGKQDEVVVISPQPAHNWIPSNIWVGEGLMKKELVLLPFHIFKRHEIEIQ